MFAFNDTTRTMFCQVFFLKRVIVLNLLCRSEMHQPQISRDVIGLGGFGLRNRDSIFCLIANGDNNYENEGIVNNSLLFVDKDAEYREGSLNVFRQNDETYPFKLSRTLLPGSEYVGRVFLTLNHYGD